MGRHAHLNSFSTTLGFKNKIYLIDASNLVAIRRYLEAYSGNISSGGSEESGAESTRSTGAGSISFESDMASESEPFSGTGANSIRQPMSAKEHQAQLDRQREIGEAGELIALEFERQRVGATEVGCPDPKRYVEHVALTDVGRGYDIESTWLGHERCIEVKSSTSFGNDIFMSENERSALKELGKKAWLYRVVIDANGNGEVVLCLNDPISEITEENFSTAVWRVRLPPPDK